MEDGEFLFDGRNPETLAADWPEMLDLRRQLPTLDDPLLQVLGADCKAWIADDDPRSVARPGYRRPG